MRHYRFPFCTLSLARLGDCSLLQLHIIVLSCMSLCEFHACSCYRTISRLFPQSRTHFCLPFDILNLYHCNIKTYLFISFSSNKRMCFMDDEVYIWPYAPFEHVPIITTLFDLRSSYFLDQYLSFDLRYQFQNTTSTYICDIRTNCP